MTVHEYWDIFLVLNETAQKCEIPTNDKMLAYELCCKLLVAANKLSYAHWLDQKQHKRLYENRKILRECLPQLREFEKTHPKPQKVLQ